MIKDGLIISFMGMGTVFTFLCVMIFVMSVMSKVIAKLNEIFPEPLKAVPQPVKAVSNDDEIALAIAIANRNIRGK